MRRSSRFLFSFVLIANRYVQSTQFVLIIKSAQLFPFVPILISAQLEFDSCVQRQCCILIMLLTGWVVVSDAYWTQAINVLMAKGSGSFIKSMRFNSPSKTLSCWLLPAQNTSCNALTAVLPINTAHGRVLPGKNDMSRQPILGVKLILGTVDSALSQHNTFFVLWQALKLWTQIISFYHAINRCYPSMAVCKSSRFTPEQRRLVQAALDDTVL